MANPQFVSLKMAAASPSQLASSLPLSTYARRATWGVWSASGRMGRRGHLESQAMQGRGLPVGSDQIEAVYSGDAEVQGSSATTVTNVVSGPAVTAPPGSGSSSDSGLVPAPSTPQFGFLPFLAVPDIGGVASLGFPDGGRAPFRVHDHAHSSQRGNDLTRGWIGSGSDPMDHQPLAWA